jgi:hypothetical protein
MGAIFRPDVQDRPTRPRVSVPPNVRQAMDATYRDRTVCELPAQDDDDSRLFLRLCRLYAERQGRKLIYEFTTDVDGRSCLLFKMRDKRKYTKISPRWDRNDDH